MSGLSAANAALYRDWQRARAGRGHAELPRHAYALISLQAAAGGRPLDSLGRDDILGWIGGLGAVAAGTRASYWSSARAFYNWASSDVEGVIERNPMRGMSEPKNPEVLVPIPALADVRKLIAVTEADRSPMGRRDTALLRVMCDTGGPRASEAAGLLIAGRQHPAGTPAGLGADLGRDVITAVGKGDKIRSWPISAKTGSALARWVRVRDGLRLAGRHARLWHTFRSQQLPLTRSGVAGIIERRCEGAGTPRLHPHQLRHFAYHHFLLAGGRENDAMILFGWTDDQMPRRYARALATDRALKSGHSLAIGDQW